MMKTIYVYIAVDEFVFDNKFDFRDKLYFSSAFIKKASCLNNNTLFRSKACDLPVMCTTIVAPLLF